MKKSRICGLAFALAGTLYAVYWFGTCRQVLPLLNTPANGLTREQFVQTHPNLDRAFRFLDFHPFEEDHSGMSMHRGQFILWHMLRHAWTGVALLCLGFVLATRPAVTAARRLVHGAALLGLGAALALIARFHPVVWFWNGK